MALTQDQKLRKNESRVRQRAIAKAKRLSKPREGARESLVTKLVTSAIKKVVQKAKARGRTKQWKTDNSEKSKQNDKEYYEEQKRLASLSGKSYTEFISDRKIKNSEKAPYDANTRIKERKIEDIEFLIVTRLRTRLGEFMKLTNGTKAAGTMELVGCRKDQLIDHLQKQIPKGESLDDYSIDHVFPMSMYNMKDTEEQKRCMNFTNLQPLKLYGIGGNVSKGDSMPPWELAQKVSRSCWPQSVSEDDLI